jgi:hypothetical protein
MIFFRVQTNHGFSQRIAARDQAHEPVSGWQGEIEALKDGFGKRRVSDASECPTSLRRSD